MIPMISIFLPNDGVACLTQKRSQSSEVAQLEPSRLAHLFLLVSSYYAHNHP